MAIRKIMWQSMEEQFLIEFANGNQTYLSYSLAKENYESYLPVWSKFSSAMGQSDDWFYTGFCP